MSWMRSKRAAAIALALISSALIGNAQAQAPSETKLLNSDLSPVQAGNQMISIGSITQTLRVWLSALSPGGGAPARSTQIVTGSATISTLTNFVSVHRATGSPLTITMPDAPLDGVDYVIADSDGLSSTTNTITIAAGNGYTMLLFGQTTYGNNTIISPGGSHAVRCAVALQQCQVTF